MKISPYKVLDDQGIGDYLVTAAAIMAAADDGVDVINMSLGIPKTTERYKAYENAIEYANKKMVSVVVSAGNDSINVENYLPAAIESAITVASINSSNEFSAFSNYGEFVDISAPGEGINSSIPENNALKVRITEPSSPTQIVDCKNHSYATLNGTSMATPFVSAAVAMLRSIDHTLTPNETETIIKETAYVPDEWNQNYGSGIVDFVAMATKAKPSVPVLSVNERNQVVINHALNNVTIYYTTDGTVPTSSSALYTAPIDTSSFDVKCISAVAYLSEDVHSTVSTYKIRWTESIKMRYRGKAALPLPQDAQRVLAYSNTPEIITLSGDTEIYGAKRGKGTAMASMNGNRSVTYYVEVDYEPWQWLIIIFLFGFSWYI